MGSNFMPGTVLHAHTPVVPHQKQLFPSRGHVAMYKDSSGGHNWRACCCHLINTLQCIRKPHNKELSSLKIVLRLKDICSVYYFSQQCCNSDHTEKKPEIGTREVI